MDIPKHIYIGKGSRRIIPDLIKKCTDGNKLLLVTTEGMLRRQIASSIQSMYSTASWDTIVASPNPDIDWLDASGEKVRISKYSAIIALGGGSVLDSAKVLSVLGCHSGKLRDWLTKKETMPDLSQAVPVIALPTTAGTGAEITPFASVWDFINSKKYSLESKLILPHYAVLDPELSLSMPRHVTLYTGLDSISHALESLWNRNCTQESSQLALRSLELSIENFQIVINYPDVLQSRESMLRASLYSGMAISITRTAIAHAISYDLTSQLGIPHGLACALFLKNIIAFISDRSAWPVHIHTSIIKNILSIIEICDLQNEILKYCTIEKVKSVLNSSCNEERKINFILTDHDVNILMKTIVSGL